MAEQLKSLHNAVAKLALTLVNKENTGGNSSGGGRDQEKKPYAKTCCMGAYCWSHGWHPVGENHTSATCNYKKEGHKTDITFTNIMGGSQIWPARDRVMPSQQTHATFAGKIQAHRLTGARAGRDENGKGEQSSNSVKTKANLLSNFYSILFNHAPQTCPVDKQDDDHNEMVNNIDELKSGVLDGTIPSAFVDSGATSNVGTTKDRAHRAFITANRQSYKAFQKCPTD